MSFTGDLEHLPIVDIIQLLHAARKSGTLTVHHRQGDNQIVFRDGFIVSANNSRQSLRIGSVLLEINALTPADLERALAEQRAAGAKRKPLIVTLLEQNLVSKKSAYKGLEILIEKTVLEILIWQEGTFTFDVDVVEVADDYRYSPEKLAREIRFNSQNVLMEALRQYDEKKRDGELAEKGSDGALFAAVPPQAAAAATGQAQAEPAISADILGLDALDELETHIPEVFVSLADPPPDPAVNARERIRVLAPLLAAAEVDTVAQFLSSFADPTAERPPGQTGGALILYSTARLLRHGATLVSKAAGLSAFATDAGDDLALIIEQTLARGRTPLVVCDAAAAAPGFGAEDLVALHRRIRERFPQALWVQLFRPGNNAVALAALTAGAAAVLPRPPAVEERGADFVAQLVSFLRALDGWLRAQKGQLAGVFAGRLRQTCAALKTRGEPWEVAGEVLNFAAGLFPRALVLLVGRGELIAERGLGLTAALPADLRLPVPGDSRLAALLAAGRLFYGAYPETGLDRRLLDSLGAPRQERVLLLPVAALGKTRFLLYADGGEGSAPLLPATAFEILADQAQLALEKLLYRRRLSTQGS